MPGPKYNYLNVRDELNIKSGSVSFRDRDVLISSSADGQLDVAGDTTVKVTAPTCKLQGSTAIILSGNTYHSGNTVLADNNYLQFSPGSESMRFPNDGVIASGQFFNSSATMWKTHLTSGAVCGWLRVKVGPSGSAGTWHTMYAPLFSSTTWAT